MRCAWAREERGEGEGGRNTEAKADERRGSPLSGETLRDLCLVN